MFTRECLLRNVGEAKTHVIYELTKLGYPAMYMKFENNVGGNNVVCEGQTWHCTDSDNKPHCIDCGENIALFLAIAALRDDSDYMQWFTDGVTRIIGTILFEDGTAGYLTDNNYLDEDRYDSYGGDRIILIEKENLIKTEKGDFAFVSKTDFDNHKGNFEVERLIKSIDMYKKSIDCSKRIIELCKSIINQKESLTFEQMFDMRNGKVKN